MQSYIKNLQSKSESTRKQILIGSLIVCMLVVGFIWVYSVSDKIQSAKNNSVTQKEGEGPFNLLVDSVSSAWQNLSASVGNISSTNSSTDKKENVERKQIDLIVVDPER